jgi:tRNA threonylcarbamoyl adenosine modification protein YeaZ
MAVPVVLALDTASAVTSVALVGAGTVVEQSHADPRGHAEVVIPLVRAVLTKSATTRPEIMACGVGPGPYTGLRVGIATARALALSWSVPLVGVCSLDAVAWAARASGVAGPLGVAMDARRREIYWATYDQFGQRTDGPGVCRPSELQASAVDLHWVGSGTSALPPPLHIVEPPLWGPSGLPGLAGAIAQRVQQELLPGFVEAGAFRHAAGSWLADHGADSGATARGLMGQVILAPEPLYLRRPDAVAMRG